MLINLTVALFWFGLIGLVLIGIDMIFKPKQKLEEVVQLNGNLYCINERK